MTFREAEARIAELELGLEKVLELFEPTYESYTIEVLDNGENEGSLTCMELDKSSADVVELSEDLLWGGKAELEEA